MSLDHYFTRLLVLVNDVVDDPEISTEGVITFLSFYDHKRKDLDRVQANNMKGRIVGDTMKHFSTMDDEPARPEREGREGDTQPMPKPADGPIMHELVIADLQSRLDVGIKRYGQPLRAFNGRDPLQDLYEELLDACVYLRQLMEESSSRRGTPDA